MKRSDIAPVGLLMATSALLGAAVYYSCPTAGAMVGGVHLNTVVVWSGGNDCNRMALGPSDYNPAVLTVKTTGGCTDTMVLEQWARPGDVVGLDPDIGNARSMACSVVNLSTGVTIASDSGYAGDGHDITCLGRWTA